jgi:hypothetical protein
MLSTGHDPDEERRRRPSRRRRRMRRRRRRMGRSGKRMRRRRRRRRRKEGFRMNLLVHWARPRHQQLLSWQLEDAHWQLLPTPPSYQLRISEMTFWSCCSCRLCCACSQS